MTHQTLPLNVIRASKDNPRSRTDAEGIEGLAASIKTDGLLQNLVVAPLKGPGSKGKYGLVSGNRRYAALCLLQERGDLADDYEAPVTIRTKLSEAEKLRIATVENVQREPMEPLDEAVAYARLLQDGTELQDLSAQSGLSITTIKRRLALTSLCDPAQEALRNQQITLAQAEALTLGNAEVQAQLVERLLDGLGYSAADLKEWLLDDRIPVAVAIFERDKYTGTYTNDWFSDDASTYFDDVAQFWELQRQAVSELAEQYRQQAAWVDTTEHFTTPSWQYDKADDEEESGVLINLSPTGAVEVVEGLIKRLSSSKMDAIGADNPIAPKIRPAYSTPLRRYTAHHKTLAVQAALLGNRRKAKEVAVIMMMGGTDSWDRPVELTPHASLAMGAETPEVPAGFAALEAQGRSLTAQMTQSEEASDQAVCERFFHQHLRQPLPLYEAISQLSDEALDTLHLLLPVLCFGQGNCDELDTGESLFNRVAQELEVDMRQWWRPDAAYLNRRTKAQLLEIAKDSGATDTLGSLAKHTKADLVNALCQYFAGETETARNWLPGVMQFPAVSQDGSIESAEANSEIDAAAA